MSSSSSSSQSDQARPDVSSGKTLAVDTWQAAAGGLIAAVVVFAGMFFVGRVSSFEALPLLQAMLPSTRFFCSAIMTASATMLTLLLTLLSFTSQTDSKLKATHYDRVQQMALLDSIAFIAALLLLLFLNIPLQESQDTLNDWYGTIYYAILVYCALLGGLLVAIILMLYNAACNIILVIHPHKAHDHLVISEEKG